MINIAQRRELLRLGDRRRGVRLKVAMEWEAAVGWRIAFQDFDFCDFVTLTITIFGFMAMIDGYLAGE